MKIKDFRLYAADILKKANIEAPVLEAGVMLCHILKCNKTYLFLNVDKELDETQLINLNQMLKQRVENVPLQYLTGETEFMSLSFKVNPSVLIPRPDTEFLVEKCVELVNIIDSAKISIPNKNRCVNVLDMCTGSGCIGISIAHFCPICSITACDISPEALELAKENAASLGVEQRMKFVKSNLFDAMGNDDKFDLIVSNPPYIETETVAQLQKEVKDHEPYIALDGGPDGLVFYRKITADSLKYLNPGGYLAFEIGYNQAESVSKLMKADYTDICILKDYGHNDRVVFGRLK